MGIFFPDNDKRQSRVIELYSDCQTLILQLANLNQSINTELNSLNTQLSAIFASAKDPSMPQISPLDVGNGITYDVIQTISPFVIYPAVQGALTRAGVSYLLTQGRIGEAALESLVGLPGWFRFGASAGGILAVIGVSLAVDAINGAILKGQLVDAIQKLIQPRLDLQLNYLLANQLNTTLGNVASVVTALQSASQSADTIQQAVQGMYNQYTVSISKLNTASAQALLTTLDNSRQSYTADDVA